MPASWRYPQGVGLRTMWRLWWTGDTIQQVPPLRSINNKDLEWLKDFEKYPFTAEELANKRQQRVVKDADGNDVRDDQGNLIYEPTRRSGDRFMGDVRSLVNAVFAIASHNNDPASAQFIDPATFHRSPLLVDGFLVKAMPTLEPFFGERWTQHAWSSVLKKLRDENLMPDRRRGSREEATQLRQRLQGLNAARLAATRTNRTRNATQTRTRHVRARVDNGRTGRMGGRGRGRGDRDAFMDAFPDDDGRGAALVAQNYQASRQRQEAFIQDQREAQAREWRRHNNGLFMMQGAIQYNNQGRFGGAGVANTTMNATAIPPPPQGGTFDERLTQGTSRQEMNNTTWMM